MVLSMFTRGRVPRFLFLSFSLSFNVCTNTPIGTHDHQSRKETRLATWFARTYHALTYRTPHCFVYISKKKERKKPIACFACNWTLTLYIVLFEWRASLFLKQLTNCPCHIYYFEHIMSHFHLFVARKQYNNWLYIKKWLTDFNRLFIV